MIDFVDGIGLFALIKRKWIKINFIKCHFAKKHRRWVSNINVLSDKNLITLYWHSYIESTINFYVGLLKLNFVE